MDDDGDGDGGGHSTLLPECVLLFKEIKQDNKSIRLALWGGEGTTGLVKDINDMKQQSRTLTFLGTTLVGIIASAVTAFLIVFMGKL